MHLLSHYGEYVGTWDIQSPNNNEFDVYIPESQFEMPKY